MQKNHQLYFAPDYTFLDLAKATDPFEIVNAYRDRIDGFYLEPAKIIIEYEGEDGAFAAGLICFTAIDAIAKTVTRKSNSHERLVEWVQKNLEGKWIDIASGLFDRIKAVEYGKGIYASVKRDLPIIREFL